MSVFLPSALGPPIWKSKELACYHFDPMIFFSVLSVVISLVVGFEFLLFSQCLIRNIGHHVGKLISVGILQSGQQLCIILTLCRTLCARSIGKPIALNTSLMLALCQALHELFHFILKKLHVARITLPIL